MVARAQQPATLVVGFLDFGSPSPGLAYGDQGLAEAGRNVAIEYRSQITRGRRWRRLRQNLSNTN